MKKLILLSALFSIIFLSHNSSNAQVKTKYGDNVSTLDGIMKAYYDVVTVKRARYQVMSGTACCILEMYRSAGSTKLKPGKWYLNT